MIFKVNLDVVKPKLKCVILAGMKTFELYYNALLKTLNNQNLSDDEVAMKIILDKVGFNEIKSFVFGLLLRLISNPDTLEGRSTQDQQNSVTTVTIGLGKDIINDYYRVLYYEYKQSLLGNEVKDKLNFHN